MNRRPNGWLSAKSFGVVYNPNFQVMCRMNNGHSFDLRQWSMKPREGAGDMIRLVQELPIISSYFNSI
jgi:hypothetical protein